MASASSSLAVPPVPQQRATTSTKAPRINLHYEDICRTARQYALKDFARENQYQHLVRTLSESGRDVQLLKVSEEQANALVRATATRFLKEHKSATWSAALYQFGLFGLVGVSAVGTAVTTYLGVANNRLILPAVPVMAVITWRMWLLLEDAWEDKRYLDQAAQLREDRRGNPLNRVLKRQPSAPPPSSLEALPPLEGEVHGTVIST